MTAAALINGLPKSGTHAALKGAQLLGIPTVVGEVWDRRATLAHVPYALRGQVAQDFAAHVFVVRNLRNVLLSWMRWRSIPITQGGMISTIADYDGIGLPATCEAFAPWLSEPGVHVVRFEALIADDATLRGIAAYLGVPYLEDAFANLPGLTRTWSGQLSDWTAHWTPAVDDAWTAAGMPAWEAVYG